MAAIDRLDELQAAGITSKKELRRTIAAMRRITKAFKHRITIPQMMHLRHIDELELILAVCEGRK